MFLMVKGKDAYILNGKRRLSSAEAVDTLAAYLLKRSHQLQQLRQL